MFPGLCIQWRMARKWSKKAGSGWGFWVLVPIFALMGALLLWWDFWSLLPAAVLLLLGLVLLWPERPGLAAF